MIPNGLAYRLMTKGDVEKVHELVKRVFDRFVAQTFEPQGIERFYEVIHPASILKRREENHFVVIAEVDSDIIGVIEVRDHAHIRLLFVDEKFQQKGIAKSLIEKSVDVCRESNTELMEITVNSSLNAIMIYEKLGFIQTGPEQLFAGYRFVPMSLTLSRGDSRMKTEIQIRPYQDADEKEVIALWQQCSLVVPWNNPRLDIERKLKVNPELFLVGLLDGKVVATAMGGYEGHRGWINYLAVSPELRKQGIGRQLVEEVETRLRRLGCPKINIQIRSTNQEVIAFYGKIGFSVDDVISMGKRLKDDPENT